jgi:uncharacterized protein YndB with AHSA1/START domain
VVKSSESVQLSRSADEVFRYVADLCNEPSWHDDIASVPPGTDPVPIPGKTYPVTFKPFMGKTEGTFTAVEVEPGRRIVYRAALAGLNPLITYTVTPQGSGVQFTRSVEMRPTGIRIALTPMMALMVPRRNKVFVHNLKRALES